MPWPGFCTHREHATSSSTWTTSCFLESQGQMSCKGWRPALVMSTLTHLRDPVYPQDGRLPNLWRRHLTLSEDLDESLPDSFHSSVLACESTSLTPVWMLRIVGTEHCSSYCFSLKPWLGLSVMYEARDLVGLLLWPNWIFPVGVTLRESSVWLIDPYLIFADPRQSFLNFWPARCKSIELESAVIPRNSIS